jgi:hypothetical protein
MIMSEIEWLKANPFKWNRKGLVIVIDVCESCEGDPAVCLSAGLNPNDIRKRHAPSLNLAIAIVLEGIVTSISTFAMKAELDYSTEIELDDLWDLIRSLRISCACKKHSM